MHKPNRKTINGKQQVTLYYAHSEKSVLLEVDILPKKYKWKQSLFFRQIREIISLKIGSEWNE